MICPTCGIENNDSYSVCRCGFVLSSSKIKEDQNYSEYDDENLPDDNKSIDTGVASGITMMAVAVIWFVLGFESGHVFLYPPILFIMGFYKVLKSEKPINESGGNGQNSFEYYVSCPYCNSQLELEEEEVKDKHYHCPKCYQSVDLK